MFAGAEIGPYRLGARIGRGGMGEVWRATDTRAAGREVALKLLIADGDDASGRFLIEARIGARLDHRNIVRILDWGEQDGQHYLAMELLEGAPLPVDAEDSVPPGLAVGVALQVLAALEHAWNAPGEDGAPLRLIHRDIKPSNLFLCADGTIKLIDFGIARAAGLAATDTRTGSLRGSLPYLAPERARNEPFDGRSDLFSLCLVLHELLTGRRVFDQGSDAAILSAVLWGPIPPLSTRRDGVPRALEQAIMWGLQRDPAARPASSEALAQALRASLPEDEVWGPERLARWLKHHRPTHQRPDPQTQQTQRAVPEPARTPAPRRRAALAVAAAAIALMIAAGIGIGRSASTQEAAPAPGPSDAPAASAAAEPAPPPAEAPPRREPAARKVQGAGWLTIDSRPTWAKIRVGGRDLGPTPIFRHALPAGEHRVEATRADGRRQQRKVTVRPGAEARVVMHW